MSSPSSIDANAARNPAALAIHLDLIGGLSGDMFIAAMVDALPALEAPVLADVRAMQPQGAPAAQFSEVINGGLRARHFGLVTASSEASEAAHARSPGSEYRALQRLLAQSPLPEPTRRHALTILALLGDAEARVHGIARDDVHFHELADWDSLLDVVAAGSIAGRLEGAEWTSSTLPLGDGTVKSAHGYLPVPAPATAALMSGYPWRDDRVGGERLTPTGAAILRHLVPADRCGGSRGSGRLVAVGSGAGTRTLPGMANIARALVFERAPANDAESVAIIEFDVDDMTGEEIALAAERLRAEGGVIDVSVGARAGKKGRPLTDFRLLVAPQDADSVAQACFTETSTLGLRVREERRRVLPRTEVAAAVAQGKLRVKIAERPGGDRTAKAAHDDVAPSRGLATRRRLRAKSERSALGEDKS
jgi:uncharacterized protein (TIGR00299 family) protein